MMKHGSGMAWCVKFLINKVPAAAPRVFQLSHVSVCSRQLSKHSIKSPFLQERLASNDSFSCLPSEHRSFADSVISHGKIYKSKCESDVVRYISYLIYEFEENINSTKAQTCTAACQSGGHLFGVPYNGTPDDFKLGDVSNISRSYEEHLKACSSESIKSVAVKNEQNGLNHYTSKNNTATPKPQDPSEPPTEQQLHIIAQALATDLPNFFVKSLDLKIYHNNILFEDNIRGKIYTGLPQYNMQAKLFCFATHLRFLFVNLDVLKITSHLDDGTVKVRWKISIIRLWKLVHLKFSDYTSSIGDAKESWLEGFSTYYVRGDGLVHRHVADKMIPDSSQVVKKQEQPPVSVPHPLAYSDRNKV